MKIALTNTDLQGAISFLDKLELAGAASRARTRLIRLLQPHLENLQEAEYALVAEHATLSDDGKPLISNDGSFTLKDPEHASEYANQRDTLFNEIAQIEGGTFEGHRQACIELLTAYEQALSGHDATIYDALLTALEEGDD